MPQHIEVEFIPTTPASASGWREPIIYVIPVEQYVAMWNANGNASVHDNLETLRKTIALQPASVPTGPLPVMPGEEVIGVVDFSTAGKYLNFGAWDGVRMAQDANPITNQNLQYTF